MWMYSILFCWNFLILLKLRGSAFEPWRRLYEDETTRKLVDTLRTFSLLWFHRNYGIYNFKLQLYYYYYEIAYRLLRNTRVPIWQADQFSLVIPATLKGQTLYIYIYYLEIYIYYLEIELQRMVTTKIKPCRFSYAITYFHCQLFLDRLFLAQ